MRGLYLNYKQLLFLLAPFALILYLYTNPVNSSKTIDDTISYFSDAIIDLDYKTLALESLKKSYHKSFEKIKVNSDLSAQSLFEMDKEFSSWVIAYFYKDVAVKQKKELKKEKKKVGGNIGQMAKLQSMIDKRNQDIKQTTGGSKTVEEQEIDYIMDIIKSRSLNTNKKVKISELTTIDLNRYKLQMILHSSKKPKVIINNNIYSIGQSIHRDIKVIKIKEEKILLSNEKETKWLQLNN
ncbi:MAG: hypothetical protein U9Q20_02960 [Campylobacterota bacterium]|nr:hypothetical protein [Campylobacterota bacterium]